MSTVMARGEPGQGVFWNCPDFFTLDGQDVLLVSPGVSPTELHIRTNIYRVGRMNYDSGEFTAEREGQIDLGPVSTRRKR